MANIINIMLSHQNAEKALKGLNGKLAIGRRLAVRLAHADTKVGLAFKKKTTKRKTII